MEKTRRGQTSGEIPLQLSLFYIVSISYIKIIDDIQREMEYLKDSLMQQIQELKIQSQEEKHNFSQVNYLLCGLIKKMRLNEDFVSLLICLMFGCL